MKKRYGFKAVALCLGLCLLTVAVCDILLPGGEREVYDSVIRLHILANSDSDYDQGIKLKVRDAILAAEVFGTAEDTADAEAMTNAAAEEALAIANAVLKEENAPYSASIAYGTESYPTREYGDISLPAGKYKSLRILLGDADGQNWWCVLFPPLCINSAKSTDLSVSGLGKETKVFEKKNSVYKFRFKLLEWMFS